jgi:hypothetical protein
MTSRVRCRPIASAAASTFAWPTSSGRSHRSGDEGSVPASSPSLNHSASEPVSPGEPAMRKAASMNVRAKPSSPSTALP